MSAIDQLRAPLAPVFTDVPVIVWPCDTDERRRFAIAGRPRVLAVPPGEAPPQVTDELEDWVRLPHGADELALRQRTLLSRWLAKRSEIWLDEHGLLHGDRVWVALSDSQIAAAAVLVRRTGEVVRRDEVRRAYESDVGERSAGAFQTMLARLRPRLAKVGLKLHSLSGGRLLLEPGSSQDRSCPETLTKQIHGTLSSYRTSDKELAWTQAIPRGC